MSRFLVTGGAGFIGSHIVRRLVKERHFVRVLDNFSSGRPSNLEGVEKQIELIEADIRSADVCEQATKAVDFVLHQAALRSVPRSLTMPHEYNQVNIEGTLNMLEASLRNKVKRFVFASSSSVYGNVKIFPEREDFLPRPISPYALTKLTGEHYCEIFSLHYGLKCVSLRYFNVFGPRQALDDKYAVVIPKFIHCLLNGEAPPIYGDGTQSRDFTYVDNVVQANITAATNRNGVWGVFNIASGRDYQVLELAGILNTIMQTKIKPKFLPVRAGDVFRTHADLEKSIQVLGYQPEVGFIDGLKTTVDYFKKMEQA